jgi:hypothetical protein
VKQSDSHDWVVVRLYHELGDAQIMLKSLRQESVPVKLGQADEPSLRTFAALEIVSLIFTLLTNLWIRGPVIREPPTGQVLVPKAFVEKARTVLAARKDVGIAP